MSYIASQCLFNTFQRLFFQGEDPCHDFFLDVSHDGEEDQDLGEEVSEHLSKGLRLHSVQSNVNTVEFILEGVDCLLRIESLPEGELENEFGQDEHFCVDHEHVPDLLFGVDFLHQCIAKYHEGIEQRNESSILHHANKHKDVAN